MQPPAVEKEELCEEKQRGALADSAATQPDTSLSSPPPSPPYISLYVLFSPREKMEIKGAWWGPLLSENFLSDLLDLGGKCCTICICNYRHPILKANDT